MNATSSGRGLDQRPPLVDGLDVPHDSTVARPGIPNGKGKGKGVHLHWEFVVQDAQLYPELIVQFKYGPCSDCRVCPATASFYRDGRFEMGERGGGS